MNPRTASSPDDPRVAQALRDYLAALADGRPPDRDLFLRQHADIADRLAPCLDGLHFVRSAAPLSASDADGRTEEPVPAGATPGVVLGDYRIVREVGRGGMGVVYEADQLSLRRRVALKVLPFAAALDPRQLARFHNEAQAAAHLHHTNIVPVYAVGCERDVHFYAMQFIDGRTLAQVIDDLRHNPQGLPPAAASATTDLTGPYVPAATPPPTDAGPPPEGPGASFCRAAGLALQAAEALQHAHELGVVHRDVKPANLMVDARGHLWVTDFGLARCQSEAGMTMSGDLLGTLRYMSPEQALAQRVVVDHRTDIYSLGVTLYELLTLRHAFPGGDRRELLRQIAFEEPVAPRRHDRAIPRDLETIVLKAVAKNPNERYTTAQELADDLRCFLEDRPVRARRPTLGQRLARWSRRHKALVVSTVVLLLMAIVGLAVGTWLIWQEMERTRAEQARADAAYRAEAAERRRAQDNLRLALEALDGILIRTGEASLPRAPERHREDQELLKKALEFYEGFIQRNRNEPLVRQETAKAYHHVGEIQYRLKQHRKAEEAFRRAIALSGKLAEEFPDQPLPRHRLAASLMQLGIVLTDVGRLAEAQKSLDQARALQEKLVAAVPAESEYRRDLAGNHYSLAKVLQKLGRLPEQEKEVRRALVLYRKLADEPPRRAEHRHNLARAQNVLAVLLRKSGRLREAEQTYLESLALLHDLTRNYPGEPSYAHDLAIVRHNLGVLRERTDRLDEAAADYRAACDLRGKLADVFPGVPTFWRELADSLSNLGNLQRRLGPPEEADKHLRLALALGEKLAKEFPAVPDYRTKLGNTLFSLALDRGGRGELAEARRLLEEAIAHQRAALKINPHDPSYRQALTDQHVWLVETLVRQAEEDVDRPGAQELQLEFWQQALALADELPQREGADAEVRWASALAHGRLAALHRRLGQQDRSETAYRKALTLLTGVVAGDPGRAEYRDELARIEEHLGHLLDETGRPQEAERRYGTALKALRRLAAEFPKEPRYPRALAGCLYNLGMLLRTRQRYPEAERALYEARDLQEQLHRASPEDADGTRFLGQVHNMIGLLLRSTNRHAEAEKAYRAGIVLLRPLTEMFPRVASYRDELAVCLGNLSLLLELTRRVEEAEKTLHEERALRAKLVADYPLLARYRHDLAGSHLNTGNLLKKRKDRREQAAEHYRQAAALWEKLAADSPRVSVYRSRLGSTLAGQAALLVLRDDIAAACDMLQRAAEQQRAAVKLDPQHPQYRKLLAAHLDMLAELHLHRGEHAEAARAAAELPRLYPDRVAQCQRAFGLLSRCQEMAEKDRKLSPAQRQEVRKGYIEQRKALLQDATRRAAGDPAELDQLAWYLATTPQVELRDLPQAIALSKKNVEQFPKEPRYWRTLGVAHSQGGEWRPAVTALTAALKLREGDSIAGLMLAMAHWHLDERDEARRCYNRALEWWKNDAQRDSPDLRRLQSQAAQLLEIKAEPADK